VSDTQIPSCLPDGQQHFQFSALPEVRHGWPIMTNLLSLVAVRPWMLMLDCGWLELVNVRPFNTSAPAALERSGAGTKRTNPDAAQVSRLSRAAVDGSIQILAKENSVPDVRAWAHWSVGSDAGEISGVLLLTVEAEHRTAEFDHTATFTITGTPTAVDRVLLALRAAYAAQIEPLLGE
jgi:hypothetical protein